MNQLTTIQPGPDLHRMIDRADLQPSTKAKYKKALVSYLDAGGNLADPAQLADYAAGLSKSGRAFLKAVVRLWTSHLGNQTKAGATPENVAAVTATLYRLDALNEAITGETSKGEKAHSWLSRPEIVRLMGTCGDSPTGRRDRIVLALLVGAGLRRAEAAALTFDAIALQPRKGRLRTVLNVTGKGAKDRVVPISDDLANLLDKWHKLTGPGPICRSINKGGRVNGSLSQSAIFKIVRAAGLAIEKPDLAPHDLRRTFAQTALDNGVPITQISTLLGHANIATTQRYLNLEIDLETTASDFIPVV